MRRDHLDEIDHIDERSYFWPKTALTRDHLNEIDHIDEIGYSDQRPP